MIKNVSKHTQKHEHTHSIVGVTWECQWGNNSVNFVFGKLCSIIYKRTCLEL